MLQRPVPLQLPTVTPTFQPVATQWATQNIKKKNGGAIFNGQLKTHSKICHLTASMAVITIKQTLCDGDLKRSL